MVTHIKRARAANSGTRHFIRQRISAVVLLFLVPWFLYSIIKAGKAGYQAALLWVGQPINAVLLILTLGSALYHMHLGLQVVIEDYFTKSVTRRVLLILNKLIVLALFAVSVLSVLKIWLGP